MPNVFALRDDKDLFKEENNYNFSKREDLKSAPRHEEFRTQFCAPY